MRVLFTNRSLTIAPGTTASGIAQRSQTFSIVSGNAWITMEGVNHDYWLSAGDSFTAIPGRLVVAEAGNNACRIALQAPAAQGWMDGVVAFMKAVIARMTRISQARSMRASVAPQSASCSDCI